MVNSRDKGARGEREFAELCREQGYPDSRRGQQFSGIEGEDVVGLPGVHVEVKRVEALNLEKAMAQSIRDAGEEKVPIVAHRKNRHKWLITMPADKWFEFYKAWEEPKRRCESCSWYDNEISAGLINHCFNEEISEEEHNRVRNNGGHYCSGFIGGTR